jgi:hypothetical protein
VAAARAESDANADFMRALRNRIRRYTIDSNGGENQSHRAE